MRLHGTTVIVTGASSGIGRETARLFARAGSNVVLAARNRERLYQVAQQLQGYAGRSLVVPTDVTDRQAVETMARMAVEEFGRVDILVNNAGFGLHALLAEGSMENIRRVFEVYVTLFDRLAVGLKAVSPRLVDWALCQFHTKGRRGER
jgi:NADP-dependent 3-hydroxy acid dehydrogenase YdfG